MLYLVLDNNWYGPYDGHKAVRGIVGIWEDFFVACEQAQKKGAAQIIALDGTNYQHIASVEDEYKWCFYEGSPYLPGLLKDGTSVQTPHDIGVIEGHLVQATRSAKQRIPPFFPAHIEYVVNGRWVDAKDIILIEVIPK